MTSATPPGGEMTSQNKNRSKLQSIIEFSASLSAGKHDPTPQIEVFDKDLVVSLDIHAQQKWSAQPDQPLTICTRHTPFDTSPADTHRPESITLTNKRTGKTLFNYFQSHIYHFKQPDAEDWKEKHSFITIPSSNSVDNYTMTRTVQIRRDSISDTDIQLHDVYQIKLDGAFYHEKTPGIEWFQWGSLEGILKGKKLGYITDPELNGKDRNQERQKLPPDLVLPYGCWEDIEDDDGREFVWLEVEFDNRPIVELRTT